MKLIIIGLLSAILFFNLNSFAQEDVVTEPKEEDKYDYLKMITRIEDFTRPIKRELRKNKIDLNFFGGALEGYDSNVNLGPDRVDDLFTELSLNAEAIYNYTDDVRLKLESDTTDIIYYHKNSANLLDIWNKAGMEMDVFSDLFTLGAQFLYEYVLFPCDNDGTYLAYEPKAYVQCNISPSMYHRFGFKLLYKDYVYDRVVSADKVETDNKRRDNRYAFDYQFGFYFFDVAIFKTYIELYRNDSNYQFYDYYDYWSFLIRPSAIVTITEKLYASGSITYQQRRYDDRLSTEDDSTVSEDTWSFNISGLYDITDSFTIAINYSYRDNRSNEPLQKYSGSIITAGIYYSF